MRARLISFAAFLSVPLIGVVGSTPQAQDSTELRAPSAFAGITEPQARSRALFTEAAKVIINPRCMNCHLAADRPTQGNDMHAHLPPAAHGAGSCQTCHTDRNFTPMERASYQSIPGHPRWDVGSSDDMGTTVDWPLDPQILRQRPSSRTIVWHNGERLGWRQMPGVDDELLLGADRTL